MFEKEAKAHDFFSPLFDFGKTQASLRHCKAPSQLLKGVRSLQFLCPMNVRSNLVATELDS